MQGARLRLSGKKAPMGILRRSDARLGVPAQVLSASASAAFHDAEILQRTLGDLLGAALKACRSEEHLDHNVEQALGGLPCFGTSLSQSEADVCGTTSAKVDLRTSEVQVDSLQIAES